MLYPYWVGRITSDSRINKLFTIWLIRQDPYNTPAHTAKAHVAGENLFLSADQQTTFSSSTSMNNDKGWCCCQC